jgi:hypothetical protein
VISSHKDLDAKSLAAVDSERKQQNCGDSVRIASRDLGQHKLLVAPKKKFDFVRKSFFSPAHGSVHRKKFLRKQVSVGLRSRRICVPAVEKVCNSPRKIFLHIS